MLFSKVVKMSKTFTYFRKTGEIRRPVNIGGEIDYEWDGYEGYDFEYTPNNSDFSEAVVEIVTDYYFGEIIKKNPELKEELKNKVSDLISEMDFEDDLAEAFEDDLKEWFKDEAQESESNY